MLVVVLLSLLSVSQLGDQVAGGVGHQINADGVIARPLRRLFAPQVTAQSTAPVRIVQGTVVTLKMTFLPQESQGFG